MSFFMDLNLIMLEFYEKYFFADSGNDEVKENKIRQKKCFSFKAIKADNSNITTTIYYIIEKFIMC